MTPVPTPCNPGWGCRRARTFPLTVPLAYKPITGVPPVCRLYSSISEPHIPPLPSRSAIRYSRDSARPTRDRSAYDTAMGDMCVPSRGATRTILPQCSCLLCHISRRPPRTATLIVVSLVLVSDGQLFARVCDVFPGVFAVSADSPFRPVRAASTFGYCLLCVSSAAGHSDSSAVTRGPTSGGFSKRPNGLCQRMTSMSSPCGFISDGHSILMCTRVCPTEPADGSGSVVPWGQESCGDP